MHLHTLGRTGLSVSELCLGTMHFGWKTDEGASAAILDAFIEAGGNFIQATSSAGVDGGFDRLATSLSEEHVGRWMRRRGVPRESIVLATRLVLRDRGPAGTPPAEVLRERCEASLRRLGTDHLDLLLLEWTADLLPLDETLEALAPLVSEGRIHALGASGAPAWRLMGANVSAASRGMPGFAVAQHDYSLVMRRAFEPELADFCRETGAAFLARSPLAGGFLVGEPPGRRTWAHPGRAAWMRERHLSRCRGDVRELLEAVAAGGGASPAQVALAWVLAHEHVTAAVIGVTTPAQLRDLIEAAAMPLHVRDKHALDALTAPPAGVVTGGMSPDPVHPQDNRAPLSAACAFTRH